MWRGVRQRRLIAQRYAAGETVEFESRRSHRGASSAQRRAWEGDMKIVAEYRERAEECRRMANRALPKHRNALIKMAQVWEILAHDREKKIAKEAPTYNK